MQVDIVKYKQFQLSWESQPKHIPANNVDEENKKGFKGA